MNSAVQSTVVEMLQDRGYTRVEKKGDELEAEDPLTNKKILVYYVSDPKVNVKNIKMIKSHLDKIDVTQVACLIVVYKYAITSFAKQFISSDVKDLFVQIFSEKELSFNITKHDFVPKHTLLSVKEKSDVLKKYKTKACHFPQILSTDPVCRYYGVLPGDMLQITRKSDTCGIHTLYRVVV